MPELLLEHDFTINADGSGKVALRWHGDPPGGDFDVARFVQSELGQAKGVAAWDEVDCALEDGKLTFTATAYFPDVSKLRFHCQGFHASVTDLTVGRDEQGNLVIANPPAKPSEDDGSAEKSDAELRAQLAEERGKLEMARGFIEGMFGGITTVVVLRTPGKVLKATNGKKEGANGVRAQFSGAELIKLFDRLVEDDELFIQLLRKKVQGPEALMEIAGGIGPLTVVADGKKESAFDYASESAAAAEKKAALMEKFAVPPPPERAPLAEGFRVAAVKIVRESDPSVDFTPFSESEPSVSLVVAGMLPMRCLKVEEVRMEAIEAADGRNLLPEDEWSRRVSFPKLAKDGRTAYFEVGVKAPPDGLDGFAKLAGTAVCIAAGEAAEVDLGFPALEPGAQGTALGAVIERLEPEYEDRYVVEFRIQVGIDRIESVSRKRAGGEVEPLDQAGYSSSGDECRVGYRLPSPPEAGDRLVARVIERLDTIHVPFAVENVDLLGRPK
jgi:hypothetical protein